MIGQHLNVLLLKQHRIKDGFLWLQTERKELTGLVKRFASHGVEIKCCDIFNFDF